MIFQDGNANSALPPAQTAESQQTANQTENMNASIQVPELKFNIQPSGDFSRGGVACSGVSRPLGHFVWALLAGLLFLLYGAPSARAHQQPPGCTGSGLGILLFTDAPDVHIGDTLHYSITVFKQGGHLGNLSNPTVQKTILGALAGLKSRPGKSP